ncbi:MAG: hypothetical protein IKW24_02675, partial [Clostridia bacterium]|nr:hypothetical protein [Clostridia bacterium]
LVARRNERNTHSVRKRPKEGEFFAESEKEGENHKWGFLPFCYGLALSETFPFFFEQVAAKEELICFAN